MEKYVNKPKCRKCGSKDVSIAYHKKENGYLSKCWEENTGTKEHLCHYCRVCGYDWITKVLSVVTLTQDNK